MANNLKIINPVDIPEWDSKIINISDYSFFHTSYWSDSIDDTYNRQLLYCIIQSNNSLKAAVS
jgi:hypothetical protein